MKEKNNNIVYAITIVYFVDSKAFIIIFCPLSFFDIFCIEKLSRNARRKKNVNGIFFLRARIPFARISSLRDIRYNISRATGRRCTHKKNRGFFFSLLFSMPYFTVRKGGWQKKAKRNWKIQVCVGTYNGTHRILCTIIATTKKKKRATSYNETLTSKGEKKNYARLYEPIVVARSVANGG